MRAHRGAHQNECHVGKSPKVVSSPTSTTSDKAMEEGSDLGDVLARAQSNAGHWHSMTPEPHINAGGRTRSGRGPEGAAPDLAARARRAGPDGKRQWRAGMQRLAASTAHRGLEKQRVVSTADVISVGIGPLATTPPTPEQRNRIESSDGDHHGCSLARRLSVRCGALRDH
jgi:hypothetical protein